MLLVVHLALLDVWMLHVWVSRVLHSGTFACTSDILVYSHTKWYSRDMCYFCAFQVRIHTQFLCGYTCMHVYSRYNHLCMTGCCLIVVSACIHMYNKWLSLREHVSVMYTCIHTHTLLTGWLLSHAYSLLTTHWLLSVYTSECYSLYIWHYWMYGCYMCEFPVFCTRVLLRVQVIFSYTLIQSAISVTFHTCDILCIPSTLIPLRVYMFARILSV